LSYLFISESAVNINTIALSGAAKVLMASWEAVYDEVRRVFIEADCKHDTLNTIDLGAHRVYTVAEATLWASFGGVSFATQVATVVSREAPATRFGRKIGSLFKKAKAVEFSQSTPMSVLKFFQSSVFSPRPRVLRKGTAAAVAEAAAAAAAAHAASELADLEKKASFFDANIQDDEGARDRARRAESDDPLCQGMIARARLDESERRKEQFREVLELRAAENLSAVEAAEVVTLDLPAVHRRRPR